VTKVKETRRESGTPTNSSVSLSQLWYTQRVKEKVAKQLNKNSLKLKINLRLSFFYLSKKKKKNS
jgi:Holliday junction resolvase RusA-like endonuclease